jgi:transcriptional regulator with XRE-family HTH domain
MAEERTERHRQIQAIKKEARSLNDGRSYLLQGLRACRLAAGLTQRQVAEMIESNQSTVRQLEREYRGAYPKTIQRLCVALEVTPEDLLCGERET